MESCSASLVLCEGNTPVTGEFSSQRPVTRSFDAFFDLHLNKRLSKPSRRRWFETPSRPLWRNWKMTKGSIFRLARQRAAWWQDNDYIQGTKELECTRDWFTVWSRATTPLHHQINMMRKMWDMLSEWLAVMLPTNGIPCEKNVLTVSDNFYCINLTHWGRLTYIWVSKLGHRWFSWWPIACPAPSHYVIQCGHIINRKFRNKLQRNSDRI